MNRIYIRYDRETSEYFLSNNIIEGSLTFILNDKLYRFKNDDLVCLGDIEYSSKLFKALVEFRINNRKAKLSKI